MDSDRFDFSIIKNLRRRAGITTEELAERAKLTRATVVKVESGDGNPTINTIEAISSVFNLSASELIRLAEVVQCEVPVTGVFKQGAFEGPYVQFPNFELYHIKAGKGFCEDSDPEHHENTFEICMVISGRVKVTVGVQSHILEPGMALRFKAMQSHHYDILEDAELLLIHHDAL